MLHLPVDEFKQSIARGAGHDTPAFPLRHLRHAGQQPIGELVVLEGLGGIVKTVQPLGRSCPQLTFAVAEQTHHRVVAK